MEVGWSQGNGNLKAVPTNEYGKVQPGTAVSFSEPRPKALSNETVYRCNTFLNLQWCFVLVLMLFIKTVASMLLDFNCTPHIDQVTTQLGLVPRQCSLIFRIL
jgi:hypothetical protein